TLIDFRVGCVLPPPEEPPPPPQAVRALASAKTIATVNMRTAAAAPAGSQFRAKRPVMNPAAPRQGYLGNQGTFSADDLCTRVGAENLRSRSQARYSMA